MSINTKKYIEAFLKIKNKEAQIIPFKLNYPQQRLYDVIKEQKQKKKPVRIIILKARQMGFSTLTEGILFKETATKFNMSGVHFWSENLAYFDFLISKSYLSR